MDHDDSPNSPPSVVSSQGSSVDISLTREVCTLRKFVFTHLSTDVFASCNIDPAGSFSWCPSGIFLLHSDVNFLLTNV